jgi:uncharacterized phiE125 gp8 family phage protein
MRTDGLPSLRTPPETEPVTVEELKKSVHISHDVQDSTLLGYLLAGRQEAEDYQRRSFITQEWDIVLDAYPTGEICLLRGPVQSVQSVVVTDVDGNETTMDLSDFIILTKSSPARMKLRSTASWPDVTLQDIGAITISYTTGYGAATKVPANTKQAIMIFASFTDDNRGVEEMELPSAFYSLLKTDRLFEVSAV